MDHLTKLLTGVEAFHRAHAEDYASHLKQVAAAGEPPLALFVCCIDARTLPNMMTSTLPGELFTIRNVGNTVPRYDAGASASADRPEFAGIEYALFAKNIRHVIVCGHSDCGAVNAAHTDAYPQNAASLRSFARHIQPSIEDFRNGKAPDKSLPEATQIAQIHALRQTDNIKTIPGVADKLHAGELHLHTWFFELETAEVQAFNPETGKYERITTEAELHHFEARTMNGAIR
ncbi:MAG: carbonic anhydrase [Candidatus Sumerlaeaceae bacterium]